MRTVAIIGGTGLYQMPGLKNVRKITATTPFGTPSAPLHIGTLDGLTVIFLSRHGEQHTLLPEEINYAANMFALKKAGATHVVSVCAVGSLQENIRPGDFVVVDQFVDRTRKQRRDTFFGNGLVAHVSFADPVCPWMKAVLLKAAKSAKVRVHSGGTYVNMEGPAFSTRAESLMYRKVMGASVIGMTNLTEAKLAREAEMCYGSLAHITDYDGWRAHEEGVTIADIIATLNRNSAASIKILHSLLTSFKPPADCACQHALADALCTPWSAVPAKTVAALKPIVANYLPGRKKA